MKNECIVNITPGMMFKVGDNIITAASQGAEYVNPTTGEKIWAVYDERDNLYMAEDIQIVYAQGLTSCKDVYDKVKYEYDNDDVLLNHNFFDFLVCGIPKIDLLQVYTEIQSDFNGDYVERVQFSEENGKIIARITELDDGTLDEVYFGNLRDFLISLEKDDTGLCRFTEMEMDDKNEVILSAESVHFFHTRDLYLEKMGGKDE